MGTVTNLAKNLTDTTRAHAGHGGLERRAYPLLLSAAATAS
jgi:hypothetical protein